MATEIERKFLVKDAGYRRLASGSTRICQGYLSLAVESTVRVRIKGDRGFITVKGKSSGASRSEWEYEIPLADATEMMDLCQGRTIEKVRYFIPAADGLTWEVDEFSSPVAGLTVAEIELPDADFPVTLPDWIGEEVTGDPRYYNSAMAASSEG